MSVTVAVAALLVLAADNQPPDGVRRVPIPVRGDAVYEPFDTTTITSDKGLKDFLLRVDNQDEWTAKQWKAFAQTLVDAKVDFKNEVLLLVRHSEASGSIRVWCELTDEKDGILLVSVRRKVPSFGSWDMAYYCWAYVVSKERAEKLHLRLPR